jgi:MerR family mercuric resistance operon transcriptional regulator
MSRFGIGELARRTGCKPETVRFYEGEGLVLPASRTEGGHRVYGESEAQRLRFIRRGRELGFTLNEVRGLLALSDGKHRSCAKVQKLTLEHADEIRKRLADLRSMERILRKVAKECDSGVQPECPILNFLGR